MSYREFTGEGYHLSPTRAYPYWSVLIRGKVLHIRVHLRQSAVKLLFFRASVVDF